MSSMCVLTTYKYVVIDLCDSVSVSKCVLKCGMYVCCNSMQNILVSITIKHNVEPCEHNEDSRNSE